MTPARSFVMRKVIRAAVRRPTLRQLAFQVGNFLSVVCGNVVAVPVC